MQILIQMSDMEVRRMILARIQSMVPGIKVSSDNLLIGVDVSGAIKVELRVESA